MTRTKPLLAAVATFFVGSCIAACGSAKAQEVQFVSVGEKVQTIALNGVETALRFYTSDLGGRQLRIETENSFACQLKAQIRQDADVLTIELVGNSPWMRWWCEPKVTIVAPSAMNVTVQLHNIVVDMTGAYRDVKIRSDQSVINFQGRADHFLLEGATALVNLAFAASMPRDAVNLKVKTLVSRLDFNGS
jgi:hypothetical protein